MSFYNLTFILLFLPAALLLYYITPKGGRNAVLLLLSLLFYAWGEPVYVVLLLLSVMFNFFSGMELQKRIMEERPHTAAFVLSVLGNLLIVGFFKYYGFFLDMINRSFHMEISYHSLSLPIGLSFFTLQGISYLADIQGGKVRSEDNFIGFALFIAMFPKVSAGPLVRYGDFRRQIFARQENFNRFGNGTMYFIRGLAKKVILSDVCAALFDRVQEYAAGSGISAATAWIGCAAFAFELYFGLSGYADMAVGTGKMFGFDLPENFNYPYTASSMAEFWGRWHLTFTGWMRDYIYYPLGGAKRGAVRTARNILLFTVLIGLFHGAALHYLVWGVYMGAVLFLERLLYRKLLSRLPAWIQKILFHLSLAVGWVFFFSTSVKGALKYIGMLFTVGSAGVADIQAVYLFRSNFVLLVLCALLSAPGVYKRFKRIFLKPGKEKVVPCCVIYLVLFVVCMAFLVTGTAYPFAYFM